MLVHILVLSCVVIVVFSSSYTLLSSFLSLNNLLADSMGGYRPNTVP